MSLTCNHMDQEFFRSPMCQTNTVECERVALKPGLLPPPHAHVSEGHNVTGYTVHYEQIDGAQNGSVTATDTDTSVTITGLMVGAIYLLHKCVCQL